MRKLLMPILFVVGIIAVSSVYIVDERERALRLWFGEVTA
ncbi:MAG TPA: protease modulator HflC, partial [Rhodobacteraceae bacterium]|nr:protease modulator HflC [Paracoccaceae bacterium]